jgi:hypothetical protein
MVTGTGWSYNLPPTYEEFGKCKHPPAGCNHAVPVIFGAIADSER